MDTNSVVGTERVEGVCSTYKQTTMLPEQNLDEITALSLQKKQKEKRGGENYKAQGNTGRFWTEAMLKITSQGDCLSEVWKIHLKPIHPNPYSSWRNNRTWTL